MQGKILLTYNKGIQNNWTELELPKGKKKTENNISECFYFQNYSKMSFLFQNNILQ